MNIEMTMVNDANDEASVSTKGESQSLTSTASRTSTKLL